MRKEKMKMFSVLITGVLCVSMFSIFASAQVKALTNLTLARAQNCVGKPLHINNVSSKQ